MGLKNPIADPLFVLAKIFQVKNEMSLMSQFSYCTLEALKLKTELLRKKLQSSRNDTV